MIISVLFISLLSFFTIGDQVSPETEGLIVPEKGGNLTA